MLTTILLYAYYKPFIVSVTINTTRLFVLLRVEIIRTSSCCMLAALSQFNHLLIREFVVTADPPQYLLILGIVSVPFEAVTVALARYRR